MLANRCRPRISGSRPMRFADALRGVGLAADASPLMGGEARSGCARWLPIGRHRYSFALAACSVRRSHRLLHCALSSRRRPRAKRATGTFRRLSASRAGRRTHRSPMPFRHGPLLAAAQPRSRSTGLRSTGRVAAPGGCKMYIATHTPNTWRARGGDLALRGLLAGLPRAFGTWVPAAPFSGLAVGLRQAGLLETRRGARVPEPERPLRRKQPASGPFPGMPPWQAASLPPCRAPWRFPAWRSRGQDGCRAP